MSVRLVAADLSWDEAETRLRTGYGLSHGKAFAALTGAKTAGSFKTSQWRLTRTSITPLRFEIVERA